MVGVIFTMFGPKTQNLVMMSSMARGMVKEQRRRSEMARLAMKMFLAVRSTWADECYYKPCFPCLYLVSEESPHEQKVGEHAQHYGQAVQQDHQALIQQFQSTNTVL